MPIHPTAIIHPKAQLDSSVEVGPKAIGMALFGPYLLGAEVAAFLLLAGLVGAFHLGRRRK